MNRLNNIFTKHTKKPEASAQSDIEEGKLSQDEDDNAPPSESTVIIEDEPKKKVKFLLNNGLSQCLSTI